MDTIGTDHLESNRFYWARRLPAKGASIPGPSEIEVVQISTVFGAASEFWTVAVVGSDEHFDLSAFEFLHKVLSPANRRGSTPKFDPCFRRTAPLGR
ncbi:hypothetical protein ACOJBM_05910 [Rhizobium beringeri]